MNPKDLNEVTLNSYQGTSGFESEGHNFKDLWTWEQVAYQQCFSACKSVLVAGAGGGREMIALSRMGLDVVGFDASSDLVAACRSNLCKANVSAKILFAPPGEAPSESGLHDALVIGRGVYHHIPGRERRIKFLKDCRKHLKDGSPLVMGDFLTRGSKRPLTAFAVSRKIEQGDAIGASFYHYFVPQEIKAELEDGGFELLEYRVTPFPGGENIAHALGRSRMDLDPSQKENVTDGKFASDAPFRR